MEAWVRLVAQLVCSLSVLPKAEVQLLRSTESSSSAIIIYVVLVLHIHTYDDSTFH